MTISARQRALAGAAVLTLATATACSGGGSSKTTTTPTPSPSKIPITQASAQAHLLDLSDVGKKYFTQSTLAPYDHALPCAAVDGPGIASTTKATYDVGVEFVSKKPRAMITEEVLGYPDEAGAKAALSVISDGMACVSGVRYVDNKSETVSLGPVQDYAKTIGAGVAYAWQQTTTDDLASQIAILCRTSVILFRYSVGRTVDFTVLPKGTTVAKRTYQKLRTA